LGVLGREMTHKHIYHFVKTFIGEGAPKVVEEVRRFAMGEPEIIMRRDYRCEYAEFVCECGHKKTVATHTGEDK